ncbi:MAG: class I SAM-dependent methyltransferase [Chloroflexota bacterium]
MNLQLATVLTSDKSTCSVQLLASPNSRTAVYAAPMLEYNIVAHPNDLVAVSVTDETTEIMFRWKRVTVEQIENGRLQVHDYVGQIYTLPHPTDSAPAITAGSKVYTNNQRVVDMVENGRPTNPTHFVERYFPQIEAMYANIETAYTVDPKQVVANGYDQIAETYREWSSQVRREEREKYTAVILDSFPAGADLLELGCGPAHLSTKVLAEKFTVTGIDISEKHIEMAKTAVSHATFLHADIAALDLPAASFDAVVAFYTMTHLPREEQRDLLPKIADWLRPGGLFVANFGMEAMSAAIDEDWLGARMYWSSYDRDTNEQMVREAGLEIVQATAETAVEFDKPITFLWIVARKPQTPNTTVN